MSKALKVCGVGCAFAVSAWECEEGFSSGFGENASGRKKTN